MTANIISFYSLTRSFQLIFVVFIFSSCDVVEWVQPSKSNEVNYVPVLINDRYAFIDETGKIVIDAKFRNAEAFSEGLAAVRDGSQWNYIDATGEVAIEGYGAFQEIRAFKDGLAAVRTQNRWGFINKQGEWVINPRFRSVYNFSEDKAYVRTLDYRNWVYINKEGQELAAFSDFSDMDFNEKASFNNQRAMVVNDNQYGFINQELELVIDLIYKDADIFSENLAPVLVSDRWGFINPSGEMVLDPEFIETGIFQDGLCPVRRNSNTFGYINTSGEMTITEQFEQAQLFSEGLAAVRLNALWGFIDKSGNMVIPAKYERVEAFEHGLAKVYQSRFLDNGDVEEIFGYINKEGDLIWAPSF